MPAAEPGVEMPAAEPGDVEEDVQEVFDQLFGNPAVPPNSDEAYEQLERDLQSSDEGEEGPPAHVEGTSNANSTDEQGGDEQTTSGIPGAVHVQVSCNAPPLQMTPAPASLRPARKMDFADDLDDDAPHPEAASSGTQGPPAPQASAGAAPSDSEARPEHTMLDSYADGGNTVQIVHGPVRFVAKAPQDGIDVARDLVVKGPKARLLGLRVHHGGRGARSAGGGGRRDHEGRAGDFARDNGFLERPFLLAARGFVPELLLMCRKHTTDKNKELVLNGTTKVEWLGTSKGGDPARRLAKLIRAFSDDARASLASLAVIVRAEAERPAGEVHDYEALELAVATWSTKKFTHFRGNVAIKIKNKLELTQFERDCSAVWGQLGEWVQHREEVSGDVLYLETEPQRRQCPGNFDEDATDYAKGLTLYRWSQKQQTLLSYSLETWLNEDEHERSSVVLFSAAEVGKSKLSHLIAQDPQRPGDHGDHGNHRGPPESSTMVAGVFRIFAGTPSRPW
jgi:hypothetical protein